MFLNSPFQSLSPIADDAEIIFVADLFKSDYVGGAELTTDALIKSSPYKVAVLKSKDVNMQLLEQHAKKFWVFGNFASMDASLIPSIAANLKYSILEYDYKYCKYRSPEKHAEAEGHPCDCHDQNNGKLVSAFYHGATSLFWMSKAQQDRYHSLFPFLVEKQNIVLSSVFDEKTLSQLTAPKIMIAPSGWIVLGSYSWVKGAAAAKDWCETNKKKYEVVWNVPYEEMLGKLAFAEGFVYLPAGADTCPRMVIEAKLSGCKLILNDNVQHAKESWFDTDDIASIFEYLKGRPKVFWDTIKSIKEKKHTISGYTTTYNCVAQKYPFEECISSMLDFCDEVVVVDGGSSDGTLEKLVELGLRNDPESKGSVLVEDIRHTIKLDKQHLSFQIGKLKVKRINRDWEHPRFAVFDGQQKAEARKLCKMDFCWQMDSDEIVHEDHYTAVRELVETFPKGVDLVALPVVEYWGGYDKVRMDVNPWKWRLSRNLPHITHGIPAALRKTDKDGNLYASEGTDGCDMIDATSFEPIQFLGFYTKEVHAARMAALNGDGNARGAYENWFNGVISALPGVFHYSWFDLPRKIRTYKGYWGRHWKSLFDKTVEDIASNNMMFDKPWVNVTDEDMNTLAATLKTKTGGWVWHQKWNGQSVPHIRTNKSPPKIMNNFHKDNK